MCSIVSMCHLLLLTTACCHSINAEAHAQQQVHLKGTQLSVTVRARKMHLSSSAANEGEIFPAAVPDHHLSLANNARYERSKLLNHNNKTKIITTTSEAAHSENYRKSRIIVKEAFNDAAPLRPTGFRQAAAPRYPLLYPFEARSMTRKAQAQSFTEMKEKPIVSKEDWTPIAYVLEPVGGITGREELKISTSMRSTVRPLKDALMEPIRETVIYGAQRRMDEKNSLAVKDAIGHDINFIQAVSRNAKPENKIYSTEGDEPQADLDPQYRYSARIKQRKGIAAKEKLLRKNQATEDIKEHSTNKPKDNIALNVEASRQKKPVKNTEMVNMNNQSSVTMKISLRRAMKTTNKSDNSSSSASSIAGHNNPIKMSTHQKPFKSNETTWPLNAIPFLTSAEEATLADSSLQTSSSELSSSSPMATSSSATSSAATLSSSSVPTSSSTAEISTSASTSAKAATSSPTTPSALFASTKAVKASSNSSVTSSSTSAKSSSTSAKFPDSLSVTSATSKTSLSFLFSTANPTTTISNNLTTAEPKICVPMLVRETSSEKPAEFIDLERIVCFPLPPDSDLNFDELVEDADEIIELTVKDRSLHEDLWNSRVNSGSSKFNKYLVLLYLILSSYVIENN